MNLKTPSAGLSAGFTTPLARGFEDRQDGRHEECSRAVCGPTGTDTTKDHQILKTRLAQLVRVAVLGLAAATLAACSNRHSAVEANHLAVPHAYPAKHAGSLNADDATMVSLASVADAFSDTPYCLVVVRNALHVSGTNYILRVQFRPGEDRAIGASLVSQDGQWAVATRDTPAHEGLQVDSARRTLRFNAAQLVQTGVHADGSGWSAVLNGQLSLPSGQGACDSAAQAPQD
jgi:hypothetical protein